MDGDVPDAKPPTMAGSEPDARGSLFTKVNTPVPPKPQPVPMRYKMSSEEFMSDKYKMDFPKRGRAIIINNKSFNSNLRLGERKGTDQDAAAMFARLNELDFEVTFENNMKAWQMHELLKNVSLEDHNDNDCFICVILSHGEEGIVYGTDAEVETKKLMEFFKGNNCPSLVGKPKIFVIQACRGTDFDDGADVVTTDAISDAMEVEEEIQMRKIPSEADFLVLYSVVPGFYSWRNSTNGSWFIQALSSCMQEYKPQEMDFLRMLTRVNRKVAYNFESNTSDPRMRNKKQIPCVTSMLTKELYLCPKNN